MNTNSYLTAAVAAEMIDSRVREAQESRLAAEVRKSSRTARTQRPKASGNRTARRWFSRPATA